MNKLHSIFLIGLFLFAAIVPTVRADDKDEADEHDRDVHFSTEDTNKIEIESFDEVLGNEIKFRAETTSDGLFIEVEFHSEPQDSADDTPAKRDDSSSEGEDGQDGENNGEGGQDGEDNGEGGEDHYEAKFRAVFEQLISYTESNGVAGYQSDENGQVTLLSSLNWNDFVCTSSVDANNASVIDCTAGTSDSRFGIVVHIVDQPTEVSGVAVNPTGIKIDVYFTKSSSDYLAVVVGFKSDSSDDNEDGDIEVEDEADKQSSTDGTINFADFGFFSWVTTATINGEIVNVVNSDIAVDSNNNLQEVVYSFETNETGNLYWDPVLAVKGTSKLTSGAVAMLPSLFLLAGLAFLAL